MEVSTAGPAVSWWRAAGDEGREGRRAPGPVLEGPYRGWRTVTNAGGSTLTGRKEQAKCSLSLWLPAGKHRAPQNPRTTLHQGKSLWDLIPIAPLTCEIFSRILGLAVLSTWWLWEFQGVETFVQTLPSRSFCTPHPEGRLMSIFLCNGGEVKGRT